MKRHFLQSNIRSQVLSTRYMVLGIIISLFCVTKTFSNNLSLSSLSYDQTAGTVTFNISWDNSWRNTTTNPHTSPNNWDAAWVFIKFRDCSANNSVQFTHGLVSTNIADHTFPASLEPTMKDGTVGIDASPNNTGVMLRNTATISGNASVASVQVTLKLNNLPSTGGLDLRVFGIEMLHVPQGPFAIGDGSGTTSSTSSFTEYANSASPYVYPMSIYNENAQNVYDRSGNICPSGVCSLAVGFPKGYNAYYMMKYEISQGQYCDFLNTIPTLAQNVHYPSKSTTSTRHTIINTGTAPLIFITTFSGNSKDDRACNWLGWYDVTAYLDWSALRPLTELEYEKACRGPLKPVLNEKAWGTNTGTIPVATGISGTENGTENITTLNANINAGSVVWTSGDAGSLSGPLRCGIFAKAGNTRILSGMGFYGALDLSGNLWEYYVCTTAGSSNASGAPSTSGLTLGDGLLDASTGNHNIANWPDPTVPVPNTTNYNIIKRGGSYNAGYTNGNTESNVSYRTTPTTTFSSGTGTRDQFTGGRGGR